MRRKLNVGWKIHFSQFIYCNSQGRGWNGISLPTWPFTEWEAKLANAPISHEVRRDYVLSFLSHTRKPSLSTFPKTIFRISCDDGIFFWEIGHLLEDTLYSCNRIYCDVRSQKCWRHNLTSHRLSVTYCEVPNLSLRLPYSRKAIFSSPFFIDDYELSSKKESKKTTICLIGIVDTSCIHMHRSSFLV